MYATAQIDITRPAGRKLVRELEKHTRVVRINYPLPTAVPATGYTLDEVREMGYNKLSAYYGVDVREL